MNAYHITSQENFEAIQRDGFIRPRTQKRKYGETGHGFKPDWIARDHQFVFFSPTDFYFSLVHTPEETYGFVYDAEYLILELGGLVGPDLLTKYDNLMHDCAQEIATQLGPKPIDESNFQAFLTEHQITDPKMIEHIRRDEASYYQDVLYGMLDADDSVSGVTAAQQLFEARVGDIQKRERTHGTAALALIQKQPSPDDFSPPLEILVPQPVPLSARLHNVIAGVEDTGGNS